MRVSAWGFDLYIMVPVNEFHIDIKLLISPIFSWATPLKNGLPGPNFIMFPYTKVDKKETKDFVYLTRSSFDLAYRNSLKSPRSPSLYFKAVLI